MKHSSSYRKLVERGESLDVLDNIADEIGIDMDEIDLVLERYWPELASKGVAELVRFLYGIVVVQSERIASLELLENTDE